MEYTKNNIKFVDIKMLIDFIKNNNNTISIFNPKKTIITQDIKECINQHENDTYINFIIKDSKWDINIFENVKLYKLNCLYKKKEALDINISMFKSIILCIDTDFIKLDKCNQEESILSFIEFLKRDIKTETYTLYKYAKLKYTKKNMYDEINSITNSNIIIRYLSDYLYINIFVIDSDNFVYFTGNNLILHKKNIILYKHNGSFYPLCYDNNFIFNNSPFFKYILSHKLIKNVFPPIDIKLSNDLQFDLNDYFNNTQIDINTNISNKTNKISFSKIVKNISFDDIAHNNINVDNDETINKFEEIEESDSESTIKYNINDITEMSSHEDELNEIEEKQTKNKPIILNNINGLISDLNDYEKMSLKEIQDVAQKYNINIKNGKMFKSKRELCKEIDLKK